MNEIRNECFCSTMVLHKNSYIYELFIFNKNVILKRRIMI